MDNPQGINATFCTMDSVVTRKQVKLVMEVPIEMADAVIARLGGYPRADNPAWVHIRLISKPDDAP